MTSKARNAARGIDALNEQRGSLLRTGGGTTAADREALGRDTANAAAATRVGIDLHDAAQAIAARRDGLRQSGHAAPGGPAAGETPATAGTDDRSRA